MAILTQAGRTALARFIASNPLYLAWGKGKLSWGETPPLGEFQQTALIDVVGYRQAKQVGFCTPDDNGLISVPNGRYQLSDTPTNHLFCEFSFDFEDGLGETIRELGLMVGTAAKPEVPAGQYYLQPTQVADPGTLVLVENRLPLFRDQGVRETFEFVVTF